MSRLPAGQRHAVQFTLNGKPCGGEAEPRMLLTDFLRHQIGATGTHVGCEHGVCGACTVEVDGKLARACLTLAVQVEGCAVRTVEGLAPASGRLSILQAAFKRNHALQCGFCTAGILMSLDHFLRETPIQASRKSATSSPAICAVAPVIRRSCARPWKPPRKWLAIKAGRNPMLDLGTSFVASVARDPHALAVVDDGVRLTYAQWYRRISSVVAALDHIGLKAGDHIVTVLQNCEAAATLHWACQLAGIVITPVNWRAKDDELDFCIENSESRAVVYQDVSAQAMARSKRASGLPRIAVGCDDAGAIDFTRVSNESAPDATPRAGAEDWSIMLYTSGTTSRPKGVPRRHRAERAAGIAHVAQNLYRRGERTLGVMPLYHTMGVRSLIAMSLIGGTFVCLPRYDTKKALALIEAERVTNLYLVPTLYHDLVHAREFASGNVSSVRKLGFAGASMTDGLLKKLNEAFRPDLFVNHYGSSEIYTFTIDQNAPAKPGSAGKAGINQEIRVVKLNAAAVTDFAAPEEEGEIIALLAGDESFEGYWRRPDADAKSLRDGWYFTGDTGFVDRDGDLFVTGRVDDMIITGGENVSPVEIESCLSLHAAVLEVAVVGLPDEKWGKVVTAFVKRKAAVSDTELDQFCRTSGLADFKRPRRFVFVDALPKSPVGKLLRRLLVAGDYQPEHARPD